MRILFIGDIMGRSGREALGKYLPELQRRYTPSITIVNGENAAHGRGITEKMCAEFYELGVDVISTGNHIWDQREIIPYIARDANLLRPLNFPKGTPGQGSVVFDTKDGKRIKVINVMCRLFMDPLDCPFQALTEELKKESFQQGLDAIFVDCHGEATSEKMAMAHHCGGKVTALIGTHTHIPTADHHIMSSGTAFMADAGMSGDYDSIIGVRKDIPMSRFVKKMPGERMIPANGEATLCGVLIEVKVNGLASAIHPIRLGGQLSKALPEI